MKITRFTYFFVVMLGNLAYGQLYFPNQEFYNCEIERNRLQDSLKENFYRSHLSIKPLMENHVTKAEDILQSNSTHYYWLTQKIFKENFIIFQGKDFWCSVDPVLDLEFATDVTADSTQLMYWNTRGLRVQARFFDKVAFTTSIYENQAIVPYYIRDYAKRHGEFYPLALSNGYSQQNGVIPGYARTKPFKWVNGYDFGMAQGQVSIRANRNLNFHFGNGNIFIGNGYRSMLLSDFSLNYPYLKTQIHALNGRLQYNIIYALQQNLYRIEEYSTPESTYERKIGAYQYLSFSILKNWEVGLFHGSQYISVDSSGARKIDYAFLNPIIYSNIALRGMDASGYKSVIGFNTAFSIGTLNLYGQVAIAPLTSYQVGLKYYDLLLPNLDFRAEYNHGALGNYLSDEERMNYSHSNLSLTHPLVGGFDELILFISYKYKRLFLNNKFIYSARQQNDVEKIGTNILEPRPTIVSSPDTYTNHVLYNQFEFGYRFNKTNNLQAYLGFTWRNETKGAPNWVSNYVFIGVRTRLMNKTLDF